MQAITPKGNQMRNKPEPSEEIDELPIKKKESTSDMKLFNTLKSTSEKSIWA